MNHKHNDMVLPGEILCAYEQYIPSDGTHVEDGYVKASISGRVVVDDVEKTIEIDSINTPEHVKINDIVIGYITDVKPHKALVTIKKIIGYDRDLIANYKGYIHISRVTNSYVPSVHDLFKIGDIIEAKVITILGVEYIELTTAEDSLGVIKAMCVNCRKFMNLNKNLNLECECGMIDSRKLSNKYGEY